MDRLRRPAVPAGLVIVVLALAVVGVLALSVPTVVRALWALAFDRPPVYAAWLALLVGLPGILVTVPRTRRPPVARPTTSVRSRREAARPTETFVATDAAAVVAYLLAQVPVPAPWRPAGKAATIANVTRSAEVVDLSSRMALLSLVVLAVGLAAGVVTHLHRERRSVRRTARIVVLALPVLVWALLLT